LRSSLFDFTANLLTESGALVEANADVLEVLLPPEVASTLEIPEHAHLSFAGEAGDGIAVSYDSEILKKMARILGEQGKFATVGVAPPSLRLDKIEERLDEKVVFDNAVFQVERKEEKRISYLLGYFKYSALSDDRQEGILACLINELNLAVQKVPPEIIDDLIHYCEEPTGEVERENGQRVVTAFWKAQTKVVKEALLDFLTSVERRMNRDIRRVHEYYHTMIHEQRRLLEKKADAPEEKDRTVSKIEAIENELKRKIQDLIGKFSIEVALEPISFIGIEATVPIFWLAVKRRKETRAFPLTFNPILKSLDPLPCEACFYPRKGHYVCDDELHIVCRECFAPCPRCEKAYCAACHPKGCPRCKAS
jgi:hypothetical protein